MASTDVKAGFWYCRGSQPELLNSNAPTYFTHLFCAFADISSNYQVTIPTQYMGTFSKFTHAARESNSEIKTLMSIGGLHSDPSTFAEMFGRQDNREVFIRSSIEQARAYNFDGLDLFWPCWKSAGPGPTPDDMRNLGLLLDEWRQAIGNEANTNKIRLLLTATVFYKPTIINGPVPTTYPTDAMTSTYLDWINVRAYDLYDPNSSAHKTAPPAALLNPTDSLKSVAAGLKDWIDAGVPGTQLVPGLPFVGFEWSLKDPCKHDLFAEANGPPPGNRDGHLVYADINRFIAKSKFTPVFNQDYVTNYCYEGNNWIGYDDKDSIIKKIDYFKDQKLRGYFAWHVCADDPANWTLSQTG
jgi:chitinase